MFCVWKSTGKFHESALNKAPSASLMSPQQSWPVQLYPKRQSAGPYERASVVATSYDFPQHWRTASLLTANGVARAHSLNCSFSRNTFRKAFRNATKATVSHSPFPMTNGTCTSLFLDRKLSTSARRSLSMRPQVSKQGLGGIFRNVACELEMGRAALEWCTALDRL
jgi:hypothetical protein